MRVLAVLLLSISSLVACKRTERGPEPTPAPSASAPPVAASAAPSDAASAREIVNLLYFTPSKVAVSSKVANPRDFPDHLVDGKPETAWNGKTSDLVGGFVAFRVPEDAHVDHVTLSAGFDAVSKTAGDLFVQNHRIASVRVERDGATLRTVALDPSQRKPQTIPIGTAGGDFKLVVEKVVPGTKAGWKELTVSELAVLGSPGKDRYPRAVPPVVVVGTLASEPPPRLGADAGTVADGPYPSLPAFCATYEKAIAPRFEAGKNEYPGAIDPPYCTPKGPLAAKLAEPFLEAALVHLVTYEQEETRVALRTKGGFYVTKIVTEIEEMRNPGCAGRTYASLGKVELVPTALGSALEVETLLDVHENPWPTYDGDGGFETLPGSSARTRSIALCRVDGAGVPRCKETVVGEGRVEVDVVRDTFPIPPLTTLRTRKIHPTGEISYE